MRKQQNGAPGTPTVDAVEQKTSNKSSQADIKLLPFHPLADMFPLLEGKDFDDLVEDIKKNGLREKIDLYQGKIADGRNRYRALLRLGVDPSGEPDKYFRKAIYTHTIGGEIAPHEQTNDDRVTAYVISRNIHRRHLTAVSRISTFQSFSGSGFDADGCCTISASTGGLSSPSPAADRPGKVGPAGCEAD